MVIREYHASSTPVFSRFLIDSRYEVGGLDRHFACLIVLETAPSGCDDEARGEPLQIPFEWCGQGLVEIVDIEDESSLRRGEAAEIHQMTIAARLNDYSAGWRAREVVRLYCGRASKVCKRGLSHPPVPNRDQILEPVFVLSFDHCDDISLVALPEHDLAMRRSRTFQPQCLARFVTLLLGENLYFRHLGSSYVRILAAVRNAPYLTIGFLVPLRLLALGQRHLFPGDFFVWNQAQKMRDAVEPCATLVVRVDHVPG